MSDTLTITESTVSIVEVAAPASVVSVDGQNDIVTTIIESVDIVTADSTDVAVVTPEVLRPIEVLTLGEQGPPGRDGGVGGAGVFILDVQGVTGIVGEKVYTPGIVPANTTIQSCTTDDSQVRVYIGADGTASSYSPTVEVNGVPVVLTETSTKRWFTGSVVVNVGAGTTPLIATSGTSSITATVTKAGAGPDITSVAFGAYPGVQTALKAGDTLGVYIVTAMDATSVTLTGPASTLTLPVVAGVAAGSLVMNGASGAQTFSAVARNSLGTPGAAFVTGAVSMDQTYPTFGALSVVYPGIQTSLDTGNTASVTCVVSGASAVTYSGTVLDITNPTTYAATKTVGHSFIGHTDALYTISAYRAANGATASTGTYIAIDTAAPTAAISITPAGRLVGSPAGSDYTVRILPSYALQAAPSMNASAGTWQGTWTKVGNAWLRDLRITDATAKGAAMFSALSMVGSSGIPGSTITSGSAYTVGGFSLRTLTFAAFSRVAAIGTTVADATKLSAQIVGGNVLALQTSNAVVSTGFYPANADGSYNATGAYIGLSDSAFAGSNTSGTLQITVAEAA